MNKTLQDIDRFIEMVSSKQNWDFQKNNDFLNSVKSGLLTNYNRYGYFLCPCRNGSGSRKKDRDIICPCVYNVTDQKEYGHCFCALFFPKEGQKSQNDFRQIPDRRPEELYE